VTYRDPLKSAIQALPGPDEYAKALAARRRKERDERIAKVLAHPSLAYKAKLQDLLAAISEELRWGAEELYVGPLMQRCGLTVENGNAQFVADVFGNRGWRVTINANSEPVFCGRVDDE